MVDVESVGFIVQIGACYFDIDGNIGDTFKENINFKSCVKAGLKFDSGELLFWLSGKHKPTWLKDTKDLTCVLANFREFCDRKARIYCHRYDIQRLMEAYDAINSRLPFSHRNHIDLKTLVILSNVQRERRKADEKTHDALEDCIYQVRYTTECLKTLGNVGCV